MKTAKPCFSNGTGMEIWMEINCDNCAKHTCFNWKKGTSPKYRCAIQRDIEAQYVTSCEVNQESYDATHQQFCPMFKDKSTRKTRKTRKNKVKEQMEMTFEKI